MGEIITLIALIFLGIFARFLIFEAAGKSAVDGHYWQLVSKIFKRQKHLPINLEGKYLLENDEQGYPPFFAIFLARFRNSDRLKYLMPLLEGFEVLCLVGMMILLSMPLNAILFASAVFISAPILATYNTQLTSRIFGEIFLLSAICLQLLASQQTEPQWVALIFWITSSLAITAVIMSHKMTLQLHLFLMPIWWWALGAWQIPLATIGGVVFFVILVGKKFALYQAYCHWDIVKFWNRNWKNLGAHQFLSSPIYGQTSRAETNRFHQQGLRGARKHLKTILSYSPSSIFLVIHSLVTGYWPPHWLMIWFFGVYVWALLTLFVPHLKCLGGGHLYIFNLIAPSAIYAGYIAGSSEHIWLLLIGLVLNLITLLFALRIIKKRPTARNHNFEKALSFISQRPKGNVAIFPLQSAEIVAERTNHSVLWGGHGAGFDRIEDFFPVIKQPLAKFFKKYSIDWMLWDKNYWPDAEKVIFRERLSSKNHVQYFGNWGVAHIEPKTKKL